MKNKMHKQKIVDNNELFPTGHLLNDLNEDEFFTVCKCVAQREEIDFLHVYMLDSPDLVANVPLSMLCDKCDPIFNKSLPRKLENYEPFPKSNLPSTIAYYEMKLLKRGKNPRDHITVFVHKFPSDFNYEEACREVEEITERKTKEGSW